MTTLRDYAGVFRIDDVSVNTNRAMLDAIIGVIRDYCPGASVLLAVSPLVHDLSGEPEKDRERTFPRILGAMSDHRRFFKVGRLGMPGIAGYGALVASHGLVHVDHRLLSRDVQEMSIVTSCSLVGTNVFVPPFNKWNRDTESVCVEHGIQLVKFEEGWKHVRFNKFDPAHQKYYLHTHDVNASYLEEWLKS